MPCSDSQAREDERELRERNDKLARIACTFAQVIEHLNQCSDPAPCDFGVTLKHRGVPEDRVKEAEEWWVAHKAEDARKAHAVKYCMKIRQHRGSLVEAMKTLEHIEPTIAAIRNYFTRSEVLGYTPSCVVEVVLFDARVDTRIGWAATYLVLIDGKPAAMTDRPLKEEA
jgi:hypothetical protein